MLRVGSDAADATGIMQIRDALPCLTLQRIQTSAICSEASSFQFKFAKVYVHIPYIVLS